jgi:carbonic anhydrase/acetyltransferase-like protein (isoleucine patch superfamily)
MFWVGVFLLPALRSCRLCALINPSYVHASNIAARPVPEYCSFMTFDEQIARYLGSTPSIASSAFIAPGAFVVGDVTVSENASIWPGCSLRGDIAPIVIGANSNVQDGSVVHVADNLPAIIGEWVTVGHKAIVHACEIGNEVLIGMGAIILDGAKIGDHSIIGANATVTMHMEIPPGSLVLGSPAKIKKTLTAEEQAGIRVWAERYVTLSRAYLAREIH